MCKTSILPSTIRMKASDSRQGSCCALTADRVHVVHTLRSQAGCMQLGTTMYKGLRWGLHWGLQCTGNYNGDSSVDHNRDYNVPPLEGVLGVAGGVGRPRLRVGPAAAPARLVAGDPGSSSPSTPPLTEAPSSPSSESVGKPPEIMTTQGNQSSQFWPKAVLTMGDV